MNQRFGEAQQRFIGHLQEAGWLRVMQHQGFDAAQAVITELCAGRADPQVGHVVSL